LNVTATEGKPKDRADETDSLIALVDKSVTELASHELRRFVLQQQGLQPQTVQHPSEP
jgi:hypothetical protein